jgi:Carboxypeptidase regulatory-like domain
MSIPRRLRYLCSLLMLVAASSVSAFGQTDTGTLLGSVVDPTQSVVPSANVTLRNTQTGATLVATTDKDGVFQFPGVLAGSYSVQVTAAGFKAYELNGISLSSAGTRNLGRLRMEIGAVAEQVKVTRLQFTSTEEDPISAQLKPDAASHARIRSRSLPNIKPFICRADRRRRFFLALSLLAPHPHSSRKAIVPSESSLTLSPLRPRVSSLLQIYQRRDRIHTAMLGPL